MRTARSVLTLALPMLLAAQGAPSPQGAQAKKPASKEEEELLALLNMEIISVSKVAQRPIDAPGVVSAVTRDQIHDYGWVSLNDVMGKQPGFIPSQDYDRRTLSARGVFEGWNNNHILVLIDGVPMNDNFYGSAYTSEITPLFMAKSLEISRGPGSALYGSNAVNGVASINTMRAEDIKGGGEARLRLGERATRTLDFLTGFSDDRFSFVTAYSNLATNGNEYQSLDGSDQANNPTRFLQPFRTHDERKNDYFFARLEGLYALEGWSLQFHQQRWSFGTGQGWLFITPDHFESMNEERQIAVLKYAKEVDGLTQEYVLRYQNHHIDWNQRYYPDGFTDGFGTTYPSGLTEYLNTSADELFARAQLTWKLWGNGSLVAGFEGNRFSYDGDKAHESNVDINTGGSFTPTADGHFLPLRGFLEWTQGHPVLRTALFAQLATGKLGGLVSITAGLRYDKQSSDFNALDKASAPGSYPVETLTYSQWSPRLGVIFHPGNNYSLKLLVGRAFRTPSPTETFGANTYALASNIRQLQPETADTVELASDWIISSNANWRINLYQAKMKNLIGYSVSNANLSTNLYTLTTRGVETELLWGMGPFHGFLNASKSKRVNETILDPTIAVSSDVTWVPGLTGNLGASYKSATLNGSLALHYQGSVDRRSSDDATPFYGPVRPDQVGSWTGLDARMGFKPLRGLEIEVGATNAFNTKGYYAKNFAYPFDYRIDPRMVWVGLRLN